jgi:hypothetical protein
MTTCLKSAILKDVEENRNDSGSFRNPLQKCQGFTCI